ncbi:exopolygalacturonase-like [Prosopis cineraria]|uniref:exopolygalacturonase-like n=1 Tax=Prosopis cineraria TaxID=364024 RepID=UPI00240F27FB|nr:exopolygalacturonase-like [Prosopis cineraria]
MAFPGMVLSVVKIILMSFTVLSLLSDCADAARKKPISGPDMFMGENLAVDKLLPGEKIINVLDFKAKPDGVTDCTQAFMTAWRTVCNSPQQARLYVPPGKFYVSSMFFAGPCKPPQAITIKVDGTILASTDPSEYVNGEWLIFSDLRGIKLIGAGTFDGQGKDMWAANTDCDKDTSPECKRLPSSIQFNNVTDGLIQGISSVNAMGFHFFITNSANIRLRTLSINAPGDSPNTDGIHMSHSINVKISKCLIQTGDDCVSMIQGVSNVAINKVTCGPGHGFSIGSLGKYADELEVKNIRVLNCTMVGTTNGLRIKSWPDKFPGAASQIIFDDIVMNNVANPIVIDQEYQCEPAKCNKKPSRVKLSGIQYSNIRGTSSSKIAVDLRCSGDFPCDHVQLNNINLKATKPPPPTSRCLNAKPLYLGMQSPPPCS